MKRRLMLSISIILVLCLGVAIFCGCVNTKKTISFYYGTELLGTYDVEKGTSFASLGIIHPKENVDGNFFINIDKGYWYSNSYFTSSYDTRSKITSNISLYLKKEEADADNMRYLRDYVKANGLINNEGHNVLPVFNSNIYNNYIEMYSDNSGFNLNGILGYSDGYMVFKKNNRPDHIFIIDNGNMDKIIVNSYDNHQIGKDYTVQSDNVGSFTARLCVNDINSSIKMLAYKTNDIIFPFDIFDGTPIR